MIHPDHLKKMKSTRLFVLSLCMAAAPAVAHANNDAFLPVATPESQGLPSEAILRYLEAAEADADRAAHSVIILRHGQVLAEGYWTPYAKDQPHELYSLSKSFTSTAVGLAVEQGLLNIDDKVVDFFPEDVPADANDNLKNMRVRQLLTMSTGHTKEPNIFWVPESGKTLVQRFLSAQPELEPGKYFLYNTPATYMQSAIVQKLTGQRVRDYLMPRLFEPLGIEQPEWDQSDEGIDYGGFGLYLKTRDIAKFGQLLLQKGEWKGKQLIPAAWLAQANSKQVSNGASPDNDWNAGYGFQFWMNSTEGFRGDGAFGQLCIVLPKADMVVAMTAATQDMGQEMRWIWDLLLPALSDDAIPENPTAQAALTSKLDTLTLKFPAGEAEPDKSIVDSHGAFMLEENPFGFQTLQTRFEGEKLFIDLKMGTGDYVFQIGNGEWIETEFVRAAAGGLPGKTKAWVAGAWETPNVLNVSVVYPGRCQMFRVKVTYGDTLLMEPSINVAFGPAPFPAIKGTRIE